MASRTMKYGRPSVAACEKRMGVWWPRGLSRRRGAYKIAVITDLNAKLRVLIKKHCKHATFTDLPFTAVEAAADEVFVFIGPRMWPAPADDPEGDRFQWLADASKDTLENLYPRDLYYERDEDKSQLQRYFKDLAVARCLVYIKNHPDTSHQDGDTDGRQVSTPMSEFSDQDEHEDKTDLDFSLMSTRSSGLVPAREPSYSKTSTGGVTKKRKGSELEVSDAKRQHNGLVSFQNPHKIVVLKLTPCQLGRASTERGSQPVHESSSTSNSAHTPASNEQPEPVSDHWMIGHRERQAARAARSLGVSRSTTAALESGNSADTVKVVEQRRLPLEPDSESEEIAYGGEVSPALPINGSHQRDTRSTQPKSGHRKSTRSHTTVRKSAPTWYNTANQRMDEAPPDMHDDTNEDTHADTPTVAPAVPRSGLTGLPSPSGSQPAADSHGSRSSVEHHAMATLECIDTEIDWTPLDKFPSSIPLQVCHTAQDFFAQIDDSRPQILEQRRVHTAQVEHHNHGGTGQNVTCRIFREGLKGILAFEKMLGRLKHYDGEIMPVLKITVEWAS
ncbi:hypothetical protein LTR35_002962 [Friedmanniomyces endolithicus]|nr:hypothetical protein LTS00_012391 [Friedmanniomyces endolithicus]KAK0289764.1 hypothetical protein LTR35_002962 [Friedmanniomyces endolithicus]KAK1019843.1 hypothetical protein LTR54_000486 [Friedmanniomyces endolithicus]